MNGPGSYGGAIYEYAHGTTTPSAQLALDSSVTVEGCATQTNWPNLAFALKAGGSGIGGAIAIFGNATSQPLYVGDQRLTGIVSVTFMDYRNIFAWCKDKLYLATLAGGNWTLQFITTSFSLQKAGRFIQWDGSDLAVLTKKSKPHAKTRIQQVQVANGRTTIIGTTNFNELGKGPGTTFALQGSNVLLSMSSGKKPSIGIYPYPQGGNPETVIQGYSADSVTVSVDPSRSRIRK